MPRPRVHPSQRQRVVEACNFCRMSKKKCSATVPCNHCSRRGIGASCYLTHRPRGSRNSISTLPLHSDSIAPEEPHSNAPQTSSPPTPQIETCSSSPSTTREPHPRMLLNSRGERVFLGGAASISFLQLIRDIVAENIGPSRFSHNDTNDSMLETRSIETSSGAFVAPMNELSVEQKSLYSCVYHQATEGFLDVFLSSEVEGLLRGSNSTEGLYIKPYKQATIDLIIAIGAQCQSRTSAEQLGRPLFLQAQRHAFSGMLEDPDVDMVRAFLLMAFYMLGECRRNSAFMYLGIATRAAVALGLHCRDSYTDMNSLKYQLRLRIWLSLCILDMLVSTILGRPSATAALRSDLNSSLDSMPSLSDLDTTYVVASYKLLEISSSVVDKVYEKKEISTVIVVELLDEMQSWSQSLPESLRTNSLTSTATAGPAQKGSMGNIHVSCLYYFAVTLVTRPLLISALTNRSPHSSPRHSQLASACVDAAVYLVQTCNDAYENNTLLSNMCILKALLFAAGLILGFEIFAKREMDYSVEMAFRSARNVLEFLAIQSPQAAHYHEILVLLSNAIEKQRDKLLNKGRSRYVSRILPRSEYDRSEATMVTESEEMLAAFSQSFGIGNSDSTSHDGGISSVLGQYFDQEGEVFLDSLDLSQWNNFPFLDHFSPGNQSC